jgi:hypothetical protein
MGKQGSRCAVVLLGLGLITPLASRATDTVDLFVDHATLIRASATKGKDGRFEPPWTSGTFTVVLPKKVPIGATFTVIPRGTAVEACQLLATKVTKQPLMEEEEGRDRWEVDLNASTDQFLRVKGPKQRHGEMPIDAVVIYPAVPEARLVEMSRARNFVPGHLGVFPATLWAAVDTTRDGKPDIMIFKSCCENPKVPEAETGQSPCEHTCESIYFLAKEGWKKISESSDF